MVKSEENKENLQTVGELLRDTRLKMGKTVGEAADELCIRKFYIKAIEDMDFESIPPMPYGLGFVRSYAKYLGLDSENIVTSYRQSILGGDNEQEYEEHTAESNGPKLKHVLFGIVGLVLAFVAWSVLPSTEQVEEYSDRSAEMMPEPVIIEETANDDTAAEDVSAAENEAVGENEVLSAEEENTEVEAKPEESEAVEANNDVIKMVLDGPSWLELRKDKKVLLSGTYNADFVYEIPAEEGYVVSVGRPHNVRFIKGGEELNVATQMKKSNISLDKFLEKQN